MYQALQIIMRNDDRVFRILHAAMQPSRLAFQEQQQGKHLFLTKQQQQRQHGVEMDLLQIPAGAVPGHVFHATSKAGHSVPIACPGDAAPGDVIEVSLPAGTALANDEFLARLGHAEVRDTQRVSPRSRARAQQLQLLEASAVHGWRFGSQAARCKKPPTSNAYLTEQEAQQHAVQAAHQVAMARDQQRQQQQQLEHEVRLSTGGIAAMERANQHAAPSLAVRPLAAQRSVMAAMAAQHEQLHEQQGQPIQHVVGRIPLPFRAPNAAAAQHEATLIGKQRQATRDPRGRAFR